MRVRSSALIDSGAEPVWDIITNASEYPKLEPMVGSIRGSIGIDESLLVVPKFPAYRSLRYAVPVTVTECSPCTRLVWEGRRWFGLLRGTRTFELIPRGVGKTELVVTEEFWGAMKWLLEGQRGGLMDGLDTLTGNVKRRVEERGRGD